MSMTGKLILVTGGAGFIGSHLCERLHKDGNRVISLDNYFTGTKENHVEGVEYREGHTKDIEKHVPERPDLIYHLGEYSRVHKSEEEPHVTWDLNISGTEGVLEFCRKNKTKLIYAGSSTKSPATKTTSNDKISGRNLSMYTWSKAVNTEFISNYGNWYALKFAICYFYNVYGPKERAWGNYGTVVGTFLDNFLKDAPHKVNSPGTQTRAFTHVLDTVDGLIFVGEYGQGDGFNICANDVWSIIDVAKMFGGEIIMNPQTKTSRSSTFDDVTKTEALGWRQKHKLEDYIREIKRTK